MAIKALHITMFGAFTIRTDDCVLSSRRTGKVWLLLAYLICNHKRSITPEELYTLLWGETDSSDDPQNALKALVHRARNTLSELDPAAGRELILWRSGRYAWNSDLPFTLDVVEFDRLCAAAQTAEEAERLPLLEQALALYKGDLLSQFSSESWVLPLATYYHERYLRGVETALTMLETAGQLDRAVSLCREALNVEPYSEALYLHLLRDLVDSGQHQEAVRTFETMRDSFFSNFGVMPSEEARAIYREANSCISDRCLSTEDIRQYVQELQAPTGPVCCDYSSFRLLYQVKARGIVRSGEAIHVAVFSVSGKDDQPLAKRILNRAVDKLQEKLCRSLRAGDVVARCSVSQLIVMLPQAAYENSCMVCERVIHSFHTAHPHSAAQVSYTVLPIEPK